MTLTEFVFIFVDGVLVIWIVISFIACWRFRRQTRNDHANVTASSGNVFADLGLPDADNLLREAEARLRHERKEREL